MTLSTRLRTAGLTAAVLVYLPACSSDEPVTIVVETPVTEPPVEVPADVSAPTEPEPEPAVAIEDESPRPEIRYYLIADT